MTHDKTSKKTGSAPSSNRSRYIPPGLLARGRGRCLQNLYSTQFQIRANGSSSAYGSLSLNPTSDIGSSQGHDNSLKRSRDPNNPLIRSPTRAIGGTPFNPKNSSVTTTNLCDEETSPDPLFSYSRERIVGDDDNDGSSHEDSEGLYSSAGVDLHPKSQPNDSINQQNVECGPQNAIDANATPENEEVDNNDGRAIVGKILEKRKSICGELSRIFFFPRRIWRVIENRVLDHMHELWIKRSRSIAS